MNWMQRAMARKYEGSEGGFTLIELLVVVLILGILSCDRVREHLGILEQPGRSRRA